MAKDIERAEINSLSNQVVSESSIPVKILYPC